jgi:hypothetical protein
MKLSQLYPSKYLKCTDLAGKRHTVTIDRVELEHVGQDPDEPKKPVLYFTGKRQGLVLNKTNAAAIADSLGDDTDAWVGASIAGKMVDCIRVTPAATTAAPSHVAPPESAAGADDIPF